MRRVAVTGARGFIGVHLTRYLTLRGDVVVTPVVRAASDPSAVRDAFVGADAVVHLAGVVSSVRDEDFVDGNVRTTRLVAGAACASGARLIHISSLAAAGAAPASAPRGEDDPPAPLTLYGRTKLEGERVVKTEGGLRWTILRPGVVYGPGDRGLLPLFRYAAHGVLPLVGQPSAAYTFIHVQDAVRAIVAAIENDAAGDTIFVGHPAPVRARDLLVQIRTAVGRHAPIVRVPSPLLYLAAIAGDAAGRLAGRPLPINTRRYVELMAEGFVCNVERLRDRLGVVAQVELPDGLADAARWYRSAGLL